MITLITVKRKKQLEWCEQALQVNTDSVKQLRNALDESEAECGREREYSSFLREKIKQLEGVIVNGKRHAGRLKAKLDKANAKASAQAEEIQALKDKVKLLEKSQQDLIEAARVHNIIQNDPLEAVGGGYK